MGRQPPDAAPLAGPLRGERAGGVARPLASAGAMSAPDARRGRSPGARAASGAPILGRTATGAGVDAQTGHPGTLEVIGLPLSGARRRHRAGQAAPPEGDLEALGARRPDGALAD